MYESVPFFKTGIILNISNALTRSFLFAPSNSNLNRFMSKQGISNLTLQFDVVGKHGSKGL